MCIRDRSCAMPGTFAVFALGLEGPKWWRLVCDYLDRCDDEHSSLQEKFIMTEQFVTRIVCISVFLFVERLKYALYCISNI